MLQRSKALLLRFLPKNHLNRGVSILIGSSVGLQLLNIGIIPVLTRLYTPEDFGLSAIYFSLSGMIVSFAALNYDSAIPIPESDDEAVHLTLLACFVVLLVSVLTLIVVVFFKQDIARFLDAPALSSYLWLLPLGVLLASMYYVFHFWAIRTQYFTQIAKTQIKQKISVVIMQLLGFKLGAGGLILGGTVSQGMGSLSLAQSAFKNPLFKRWTWKKIFVIAKKYKKFPIYVTAEGILNTLSVQLPPILLALFFSPIIAGFYALAHRLLVLPVNVIGNAVKNVFLSEASIAYREGRLIPLFENILDKLILIILPALGIIFIDAPNLFYFIFGNNWAEAGVYARWMTFWLGAVFIATPFNALFSILEKQQEGMLFQLVVLLGRTGSIFIGFYFDNILIAIILFSIFSGISWIGIVIRLAWHIGCDTTAIFLIFIKRFLQSMLLLTPFIIGSLFFTSVYIWWSTLVLSAIFILFYYYLQLKGGLNEA